MTYSKNIAMLATVFLVMMLLINESAIMVNGRTFEPEEKKICTYKSEKWWGPCLNDIKCSDTCKNKEGFEGGDCQGFRRRCYCYNHCQRSGSGNNNVPPPMPSVN